MMVVFELFYGYFTFCSKHCNLNLSFCKKVTRLTFNDMLAYNTFV